MSEVLTSSMSASEVCDLLNDAFSEQNIDAEVSASMSAAEFCEEVNGAFSLAGVECSLAPTMTNMELVSALDAALEDLDNVPWDDENDNIIKFLHVSDCHGYTPALSQCKTLLGSGDYAHLFVTGDITAYGGSPTGVSTKNVVDKLKEIRNIMTKDGEPTDYPLIVAGNHDICDNSHESNSGYTDDNGNALSYDTQGYGNYPGRTQAAEQAWQHVYLGSRVEWGDTSGYGCYWYKDVTSGNKTIRIIALDQYEGGTTQITDNTTKNRVGYKQAQIDWLYKLLLNKVVVNGIDVDISPADYLMIIMHEPPCQTPNSASRIVGEPESTSGCLLPTDANANSSRLFVSELHYQWGNTQVSGCGINLLPKIMRAYLHKESITFQHTNALSSNNNSRLANTISVNMDFRNHDPAKFIGYVCGHLHWDVVSYIPDKELPATLPDGWEHGWGDQLVLDCTASGSGVRLSDGDDLIWNYDSSSGNGEQWALTPRVEISEPTYRINRYTVNLTRNKVKVERIGNGTTALYNSTNGSARAYGGRKRGVGDNSMTISFNKKIN